MPHCCAPSDTRRAAAAPFRRARPAACRAGLRIRLLQRAVQDPAAGVRRLDAPARAGSGQRALARAGRRRGARPLCAAKRPRAASTRSGWHSPPACRRPSISRVMRTPTVPGHASLQCGHDGERRAVHGRSGADAAAGPDDGLAHRRQPAACDRPAGAGDRQPGRVRSAGAAPGARAGSAGRACAPGSPPTGAPTRCSTWPAIRATSKPCCCSAWDERHRLDR